MLSDIREVFISSQHADAIAHAAAALKIREQIEDPGAEEVRRKLAQWHGQDLGGESLAGAERSLCVLADLAKAILPV